MKIPEQDGQATYRGRGEKTGGGEIGQYDLSPKEIGIYPACGGKGIPHETHGIKDPLNRAVNRNGEPACKERIDIVHVDVKSSGHGSL